MLWEKQKMFWKAGLAEIRKRRNFLLPAVMGTIVLFAIGCDMYFSEKTDSASKNGMDAPETNERGNNLFGEQRIPSGVSPNRHSSDMQRILALCSDIYEKAAESGTLNSFDTVQSVVTRLGENGYTAVDSKNQINMTNTDHVLKFCEASGAKKTSTVSSSASTETNLRDSCGEETKLTILAVTYTGGLIKYDFKTEAGNVNVTRVYCQYEDGDWKETETISFTADAWKYTEEGYLLFGGNYYSESYYILTLSDVSEQTALRVEPLDEKCREQNRKCILPAGYQKNNLFLTDWSEEDFNSLNFYDLFDCFYPLLYQKPIPYVMDDNLGIGAVYRIPAELFENVIQTYIHIDCETLRTYTVYFPEDKTYEYKPRGFNEIEYPEIPYPEVVCYTENQDGTITLTVNAVYPDENTSKAFSHEVVIRPLSDEGFQFVSNRVIFSRSEYRMWWHSERLSEEAWEEIYGVESEN